MPSEATVFKCLRASNPTTWPPSTTLWASCASSLLHRHVPVPSARRCVVFGSSSLTDGSATYLVVEKNYSQSGLLECAVNACADDTFEVRVRVPLQCQLANHMFCEAKDSVYNP